MWYQSWSFLEVGGEAGPDGRTEGVGGTAARDGPAEVVELIVGFVVIHHSAMLLSQRSGLGLSSSRVVEDLRTGGQTLDVTYSVRQHGALTRPPDHVVAGGGGGGRLGPLDTLLRGDRPGVHHSSRGLCNAVVV